MSDKDRGWKISWTNQGQPTAQAPSTQPTGVATTEAVQTPGVAPAAPRLPRPTWMIGCGNLGGALVAGWRGAGIDLADGVVIRPSGTAIDGLRTVRAYDEAGEPPRLVVLAFKPQKLDEIAPQLQKHLTSQTVVVSLLAGVEAASLRRHFPEVGGIVRAMPNLGIAIRRGVTALYSDELGDEVRKQISDLFAPLGFALWAVDEARLAAVGSVAGAGPAYVARFISALAKAGEGQGLSPDIAATVAIETVFGTAWLAASTGESMEALAKRVASPGGTTEAGLAVLDKEHVLDQLIGVTIDAAAQRGAELAMQARSAQVDSGETLH